MTDTKPTIAFIGLGIMVGHMAANLVKAGYPVTGYNRSRGKVDTLVENGGRGAESVAEAVADADVIVTPRIGLTRAADWPLRYLVGASPYASRTPAAFFRRPYRPGADDV